MFIRDLYSISPQLTHNLKFESGDFRLYDSEKLLAIEPDYLKFVPANLLRRMGKAVRMGIGAGVPLIERNSQIDGIIIGTANGGLEDCVKFLNQIVEYNEGVLTPTNFVQSTPNAVAGQLALISKNTAYNMTHVNGSLAFENAMMDAMICCEQDFNIQLLLGGVEEISEYTYTLDMIAGRYKEKIISNKELFSTQSNGTICGEGATLFVVSNQSENAISEIVDLEQITYPSESELHKLTTNFLSKNEVCIKDVGLIIFGNNGDKRTDHWYSNFQQKLFPETPSITYKEYCGDYRTSSAFAVYLGSKILSKSIRQDKLNRLNVPTYLLIYNHFDGVTHGIILLKSVLT